MKRIVFPEEKSVKGAVSYGKKAVGAFLITGMVLTCVCLKDRATAEGLQEGQVSQPVVQKPDGGGGKESKVIALVNGMAITEADIERDMAVISAARQSKDVAAVQKETLNKLIIRKLAYKRAKTVGFTVSPKEIEEAIDAIKLYAGGEESFRQTMALRKMSEEDVRRETEEILFVKKLYKKEVLDKIVIDNKELEKEMEKAKSRMKKPEKVVVDDVVVPVGADDKHAGDIAQVLLDKLRSDPSRDPASLPADNTFVVKELELSPDKQNELYDEAKKLKEGEISSVIRTSDGYHIVRLKRYIPAKQANLRQVHRAAEDAVRDQAIQKRAALWEAELKKGAIIEILETGDEKK